MGYLKKVGTVFIYIGATLAFITFLPGLPPDVQFAEYSIEVPRRLHDDLTGNGKLNNAEILFAGELKGAESFDSFDGQLYSGLHGGYVIRFADNKLVPVVKFGKKCDGIWQEDKCGRPLGMKFDKEGSLYVIDAYYGIFKVNVKTGKYKLLVNISQPIEGKTSMIPNSIDIADNGDLYWSDSSTEFKLYDGVYALLANPTGRLIRYNAATKKNEVLMKNLAFANGVQLSSDQSFVIVAETLASRVMKYNLKGPKAGKSEVFIEALPGFVDNIHSDHKDGFLVSLIGYIDADHPDVMQCLIPHPYIRKMLLRLLKCIEIPFSLIQDFYPNIYAEKLVHMLGSFETTALLVLPKATSLRMDVNGRILEAADTTNGKLSFMSSSFVHDNYLWLGSPVAEHIARIPLKEVFPDLAQSLAAEPVQRKQVHPSQSAPPEKPARKEPSKLTDGPSAAKPAFTQESRGSESEQIRKPREAKATDSVKSTGKPVVKSPTTAPPTTVPPPNQTPKPTKKATPKVTTTTTSAPTTKQAPTITTPKPTAKPTPVPTPAPSPKVAVNAKTQSIPMKEVKKEADRVETPKPSAPVKKSETSEKKPAAKSTDSKPVDAKPKQSAESVKQTRQSIESKPAKQTQAKNRPSDEL